MAHHQYHKSNTTTDQTIKVLEQCRVSPPPGSVPSTSLPLSFFDIPWIYCHPVQRIFFYHFPYPTHHFLQTVLPPLKHSLSLTLQHFFPFAANLSLPSSLHDPSIIYLDGDSVPFTVAESTADFTHLVADSPTDVRDLHPFVPVLPSPRTLEDGTRLIPLMAIQVTVLSNSGFSISVTFTHVAGDGRAFHHFMKFWASVCRARGDLTCLEGSLALPCHNRDTIEDPKGLKLIYLEELRDSASKTMEFAGLVHDVSTDKVRTSFVLSRDQIDKLKKWVSIKCTSNGSGTLHISTFVVTCSLMWVCMVKSEETQGNNVPNNLDELYTLVLLADCRNHPEFSVPSAYFGNCLVTRILALKRRLLVEKNGFVEAVNAIESEVRDIKKDALRGAESLMSDYGALSKAGVPMLVIADSSKLGVYETDFGWGKPKKSEVAHIEFSGSISLSDCRDKEGGIEVGVALGRIQMNNFTTILEEQNTSTCFPLLLALLELAYNNG